MRGTRAAPIHALSARRACREDRFNNGIVERSPPVGACGLAEKGCGES